MLSLPLVLALQWSSSLVAASPVDAVDGPAFATAVTGREIALVLADGRVVGGTMVTRAAKGYVIRGEDGVVVTIADAEIVGIKVETAADAISSLRDRVAALELRPTAVVAAPKAPQTSAAALPAGNSPFLGTKNAPIVVTVFGSLQCRFTARAMPMLRDLLDDPRFKGRIQVVFKHFPLSNHTDARPAAQAALAARTLGGDVAFFAMVDKAFANQRSLTHDNFVLWSRDIGLDPTAFEKTLNAIAPVAEKTIDADRKLGEEARVRGTPTIFVNGWELERRTPDGIDALLTQKQLKR